MKVNITEELSTLTTIDEMAISRLLDKIRWCASDAMAKASICGDNIVELDIGVGVIQISINGNSMKYKFIPSKLMEKCIIDSYVNECNQLNLKIEKSLAAKLTKIYKEML